MKTHSVATLTIKSSDGTTRTVPLYDGSSCRIGRSDGIDIVLPDPSVSRVHAMLSASKSGVVVSDLTSTNGTFVNGKRISAPVDLQPTDVVDIGSFKLSVAVNGHEQVMGSGTGRTMTAHLKPSSAVMLVLKLKGYYDGRAPAENLKMMRERWVSRMRDIVTGSDGTLDKVLDDSILVAWYGFDNQKISAQAVKAANELIEATEEMNSDPDWAKYKDAMWWSCKAALNSGFALLGKVGGGEGDRSFIVLGDTANVAFKMAEAGIDLPKNCLLSEALVTAYSAASAIEKLSSFVTDDGQEMGIFGV